MPQSNKRTVRSRFPSRDVNHLPANIGLTFERSLRDLVEDLSSDGTFKSQYLRSECFSKYLDPDVVSPDQRRAAAINKWMAVEETNRTTNERLLLDVVDFGWGVSDQILDLAALFVAEVLGPLSYPSCFEGGSFTNGASTRVRRSPKAAIVKHAGKAHVSDDALKHWLQYASNTRLSGLELEIVNHSVLFTVPKASDIDRVACKEPEINMFLQRAIGSRIRSALRRKGIDLNDQSRNQYLASVGLERQLATVDLSSASDSISQQLVFRLLPYDWWKLLDDLRVKSILTEDGLHDPAMFSSMGNGFTFELESLIFWALTRSVCALSRVKGTISVYGDDIIAPCAIVPRLTRFFSWCGFKVNTKKSHWRSEFRESCGKHYHRGKEVTPFYLRGPVSRKTDMVRVLNQLLTWDADYGLQCFITEEVAAFHLRWSAHLPTAIFGGQDPESNSALVTGDPPDKRILLRGKPLSFDQQAGLDYWLTMKESVDYPLACDPRDEGRPILVDQPSWLCRTAWDPYLIWYRS